MELISLPRYAGQSVPLLFTNTRRQVFSSLELGPIISTKILYAGL